MVEIIFARIVPDKARKLFFSRPCGFGIRIIIVGYRFKGFSGVSKAPKPTSNGS
jgi:hypothetical protein